jgi:hypothetical protein
VATGKDTGSSTATADKREPTIGEDAGVAQTAGDIATATDTIVKRPTPEEAAEEASKITLLPLNRQNGEFVGGEHDLGPTGSTEGKAATATSPAEPAIPTYDGTHSLNVELRVPALFGGPDSDVALDISIMHRKDTTEDWVRAGGWGSIREAGVKSTSVSVKPRVMVIGQVTGTTGGHAVDCEVVATKR